LKNKILAMHNNGDGNRSVCELSNDFVGGHVKGGSLKKLQRKYK
jgi:hypothetical protein